MQRGTHTEAIRTRIRYVVASDALWYTPPNKKCRCERRRVQNGHIIPKERGARMKDTEPKGLAKLAQTSPGRSYRAGASPLYRWLSEHSDVIETMRTEKKWPWERLVNAAIEEGVPLTNDRATCQKCRVLFYRIRKMKRREAQPAASEGATVPSREFTPSRVPADWRPPEVDRAYSEREIKKGLSAEKKTLSVADQETTLPVETGRAKETPDERVARLTDSFEEKFFARQRAKGPGFLME